MTNYTPKVDDRYRRYAALLRQHNDLLTQASAESELDSFECEMTQLWDELEATQQRSLSGLSSDLNWLRRGGELAPRTRSAAQVSDSDLHDLSQARDAHEWHKLLHYLRLCAARLSPFDVAFLRATAWQVLGFPQLAQTFSGLAAQLEPNNSRLAVLALPVEKSGAGGPAASVE